MKSKKIKRIVIIAVIIAVAAIGINMAVKKFSVGASADETTSKEVEYTVEKGNISSSVSESGSVNPIDERTIKSEIDGTVNGINVAEGDVVTTGQLLMTLTADTTDDDIQSEIEDIQLDIDKAQRELNKLYESQSDLNIYAPISGVISGMDINPGDEISSGSIATIEETKNSCIEVYFIKDYYDKISVGDSASVFMTAYFTTESGTVTEKDSTPVQTGGGLSGYKVTVKIGNPGGYSVGDTVQVSITNSKGTFQAMSTGEIVENQEKEVKSNISGTVESVLVENGGYVNKGDLLATLEGDDLSYDITDKLNTIADYQSQIDDLLEGDTVYSPMDGTVLEISVSEEEVVDRSATLLTIANLDNMEVVISVDELDIDKVQVGQAATITSDTYTDEKFTGTVTNISMIGTNSSGVTTYDVTVKLDDRKSLMSAMNVDVEIISDSRENVLTVPIDAVHRLEGKYMVTVKDSSGNKTETAVELGLATEDEVEITSGLNEGDIIVYNVAQSETSTTTEMGMPGMMGGPSGGQGGGQGGGPGGRQ